jgi:protein LSM14
MNVTAFIGSKISLISRAGIRYEGILYNIDATNSTVALSKVKSYGTEDRSLDRPIPPREEIYEYILFRGSDIQDIHVSEYPSRNVPLIKQDSAIIRMSRENPRFSRSNSRTFDEEVTRMKRSESDPQMRLSTSLGSLVGINGHRRNRYSDKNGPTVPNMHSAQSVPRFSIDRRSPPNYYQHRQQPERRMSYSNVNRGYRGGYYKNRNTGDNEYNGKKAKKLFKNEYDFETENAKFESELKNLNLSNNSKAKVNKSPNEKPSDENSEGSNDMMQKSGKKCDNGLKTMPDGDKNITKNSGKENYDREKSFFDNISSESKDRAKGSKQVRTMNWRDERRLNSETFGYPNRSRRNTKNDYYYHQEEPQQYGYYNNQPTYRVFRRQENNYYYSSRNRSASAWRNSSYNNQYQPRNVTVGWR